jgi:hypothetical protein
VSALHSLTKELTSFDQLYIKLYPDQLSRFPGTIEAFVSGVWELVGAGAGGLGGVRDDLVSPHNITDVRGHTNYCTSSSYLSRSDSYQLLSDLGIIVLCLVHERL